MPVIFHTHILSPFDCYLLAQINYLFPTEVMFSPLFVGRIMQKALKLLAPYVVEGRGWSQGGTHSIVEKIWIIYYQLHLHACTYPRAKSGGTFFMSCPSPFSGCNITS